MLCLFFRVAIACFDYIQRMPWVEVILIRWVGCVTARRGLHCVDSASASQGHGSLRRHADKFVLQPGRARSTQRLYTFPAAHTRAHAPRCRVREPIPSFTAVGPGSQPPDAPTAPGNGRRGWKCSSGRVPAATAAHTTDVEPKLLTGSVIFRFSFLQENVEVMM